MNPWFIACIIVLSIFYTTYAFRTINIALRYYNKFYAALAGLFWPFFYVFSSLIKTNKNI
jgi:hypothetical protein